MTRLFEFIVALFIVFVLALVVGVLLPSSGHIERSTVVQKDIRHVYDLFDNYRRFPDYSALQSSDPSVQYTQSPDKWYGPGANISWTGNPKGAGNGKLTLVSATPDFDKVDLTGKATFVWALQNDWHGHDKQFVINLQRTGEQQKFVRITWAYNVKYGWNLINRYAGLYIHGRPDALIQFSLKNFGNMLASIPNVMYGNFGGSTPLDPSIVELPQQPVLLMSTSAPRDLSEIDTASDKAVAELQAAAKKLGLTQVGPRIRFTTNWGDKQYVFDVAIPVNSSTVTLAGKSYTLTAPHAPAPDNAVAGATSAAGAASVASAGSAPASASSAVGPQPGSLDDHGRLIIDHDVRAMLAFGGKTLEAQWYGSPAGVAVTRMRLEAYADTHGYPFDDVANRPFDIQAHGYQTPGPDGKPLAYDQQLFDVYLPLKDGPAKTPEQAAGLYNKTPFNTPAMATSAPANASSAPAGAASAPAKAATAG
ncbi:MAG TPA: polyketide cyclase [Rhodanobacteraceae bacterium]